MACLFWCMPLFLYFWDDPFPCLRLRSLGGLIYMPHPSIKYVLCAKPWRTGLTLTPRMWLYCTARLRSEVIWYLIYNSLKCLNVISLIKGIDHPKMRFCHHLLTPKSFQTHMTAFLMEKFKLMYCLFHAVTINWY